MSAINLMNEAKQSMRMRALAVVGCVLGIGSSVVHAAPATSSVPSIAVKYSDLDLATDAGAHALYSRIATAARAVCPDANIRDLSAFANNRECQSEAIARAVRDVRSPRLAAVYNARTNHG